MVATWATLETSPRYRGANATAWCPRPGCGCWGGFVDPGWDNCRVRITAKADYAVRAALELAASPEGEPVKGEELAERQGIPLQFLEHILLEMKHARLIRAKRGYKGGYWLDR